jgi:hypothetical protein
MNTKYFHYIHPHFPLGSKPPTGIHSQKRYILPSCYSFCKNCLFIVQGDFALVLQVCIYCVFMKFNPTPLLLLYFLSACSSNSQQFTVQCKILYSYIDGLFWYFSFFNIFFLVHTSHSSLRQTNTILFSVTWSYMCFYIHLTYRLTSTYERKHVNFDFFEFGLLQFTWTSRVPSIYLQTI